MKRKLIFIVPLAILGMAAFTFIGGEIVMRLWNWLLPSLFGFRTVTFWEAIGILALCRILFGGVGWRSSNRSQVGRRVRGRMAERWDSMTPGERERFRQGMWGRCGFGPPPGESKTSG